MPKGQKKEGNVVKIQVEAKNPRRRASRAGNNSSKIPQQLIETTVQLQKVYTDIAVKLDRLSSQISSLLSLFETAAKTFAENPLFGAAGKDKELIDKIDKLLAQDRIIAKTLTLLEERTRENPEMLSHPAPGGQVQQQAAPEPINYQPSPQVPSQNKPLPRY